MGFFADFDVDGIPMTLPGEIGLGTSCCRTSL